MRVISLGYHHVIDERECDFGSALALGRTRYNVGKAEFKSHLVAMAQARGTKPLTVLEFTQMQCERWPFLLTFDDGHVSSYTCVADLLEELGWHGYFFVSTDYIGMPGFVTSQQIRALRDRGHIIGSHSCSHPERMSYCNWSRLIDEWTRSVTRLSDILGEQVTTASVPGGYYSRRVAEAASVAGIRTLFNSEPVTKCHHVDGCTVLGRYTILRRMSPAVVTGIAAGAIVPRLKQLLFWRLKGIGKRLGGESYLRVRQRLIKYEWYAERLIGTAGAHFLK
jgi:peptidoglycan/xylan/chitin deacetylase (PgdA/CDA1 family)